jgi:SAM-dependent methyltransferase
MRSLPRRALAMLRPHPLSTSRIRRALFPRRASAGSSDLPNVSPDLRAFTERLAVERRSILQFVERCAVSVPPGARVLDAGAGDAPYRELFAHTDYTTTDWTRSVHAGARAADIVAPLDDLPLEDASVDAVLCTQVLEHVESPAAVLAELHRVLRPGGCIWLTAPLVWPLHEEPYDFFRYTPYSLERLLTSAGFSDVEIAPRNGYFATVAQLLRIAHSAVGWADDGRNALRGRIFADLSTLAGQLERFDDLDRRQTFPLGYQATARCPA